MSRDRADPEYRYQPAWWLRNAHAQTMWGRFARRAAHISVTIEKIDAPDGDRLELHHVEGRAGAPRILLLHGLEGSPRSHYVRGVFFQAQQRGWSATLLVFRGCGETPNLARRFYHSGETEDLDLVFRTVAARFSEAPWFVIGISLGGNVLLKWLGERGSGVSERIRGAAAVSVPFDLEAGSRHISRGLFRVYDRSFLRSLKRKALAKLVRYPGLFDRERALRTRTVFEFDDAVTGPVHGFTDASDYYQRSSSLHFLGDIRVPTLLLSSADDPFLPASVLSRVDTQARTNPHLTVEFTRAGGHVGFVAGGRPWRPFYYAEWRVFRFFEDLMERVDSTGCYD